MRLAVRARLAAAGWLLAVLLAACDASHPLLDVKVAEQVGSIDLAEPPTTAAAAAVAQEEPAPAAATASAAPANAAMPPPAPIAPPVELPKAQVDAAPGRIELSVADVRRHALVNNLEIRVEQVRPAIAKENSRVAEARFEPTGFASYSRNERDRPGVPSARDADDGTTWDSEVGIRVPLQTGGTATITMPITYNDFGVSGVNDIYDTAAGFSISQPLLRDAGVGVNIAPVTIARLAEQQQGARAKLAVMNVLANAERDYWSFYAAARGVEVRLNQYERARTQEHQALRLSEEGVAPAIEVTRARAGVARRIEDIIVAENQRRQLERELKRVMNRAELPVQSVAALVATTRPDPRRLVIDVERALGTAHEKRMELLDLELQMAIDSLSVDVARNAKLPALAVDYSFRYLGAATRLSRAFGQVGDTDFTDHAVGIRLEVPLGNQAREARFRSSILERALTQATSEQQRQFIARQVLDAIDSINEAWQRILAAREESLMAGSNYQAEQRQFLLGVRTSTDVLNAADLLAEAQLREVNALAAYEIAKIDLGFVTGTLLGSGKVELRDYGSDAPLDDTAQSAPSEAPSEIASSTPASVPGSEPSSPSEAKPVPEAAAVAPTAPSPAAAHSDAPTSAAQVDGAAQAVPSDIGPVTATDTLWSLARRHRPDARVTIPRMVAALQRANPTALVAGDPAKLRPGVMLRMPGPQELEGRVDHR
ncbi:MAG: TolC family protein [Proteobacteria bacterium]|nr:TolC family protein [Pseudomonadota bacterium]